MTTAKSSTQSKQIEQFVAPYAAFNKLVYDNVEKLVGLQMDAMQKYAQIGLENWKASLAIKDVNDLQEFAQRQRDIMQDITSKMIADAKVASELGGAFITDARKLVQDNVEQATKKAA
jgi:phasin family protein